MESPQERLASAYRCALASLPQHWLDQTRKHEPDFAHLSGLFLPGTSPGFKQASKRIMVVGRETRSWEVLKADEPFADLGDYIHRAMGVQQKHFAQCIGSKADKGESFFNFLRKLRQADANTAIAWANLFSFAWRRGSPSRWRYFEELKAVSKQLLKAQIDILQPDIVIFANGASSARIRQEYFPHKGELSVCTDLGDYRDQGIPLSQLWRFRLFGSIQCYRIQHPSSISVASREARRFLLNEVCRPSRNYNPQHDVKEQ